MSCIPLYPFYVLFRLVFDSNDGIILYLRILYVVFQLTVSVVCYLRLRHLKYGSILICLVYLSFTPFNIAALSYNTMGLGFAMLTFTLLVSSGKHSSRDFFFCGICLAFCVLCNPFTIILYFLYAAACAVQLFLKKRGKCVGWEEFTPHSFLWLTAGAFLIFLIFWIMLFRRASFAEFRCALPYNFQMPGYEQNSSQWLYKLTSYFKRIYEFYPYLIWSTGVTCLIMPFDKKRTSHALWYLLPTSIAILYYLYFFGFIKNYVPVNFCVMPLAFLGFICFLLLPQKNYRYFWFWFLPGILYSLCSHFSSDTGILCITSSFVLCSSVGALFLYTCYQELMTRTTERRLGKTAAGCIIAVLAVHICIAGHLRFSFFYNEAPLSKLTAQVKAGPAKGLFTTPDMAAFHTERVNDLKSLNLTEEDSLLVIGIEPWAYLCTDASCATYSCWGDLDELSHAIYLTIFPQKYPTVIYCTDYETALQETNFLQEFFEQGYETISLESATVLVKSD